MARIEVVMPQMGESITEGTIVRWHKKVGDPVTKDETLLEISTDKVDTEIPSPASGILAEIVIQEQQTVPVRTVIAYLETGGEFTRPDRESAAASAGVPIALETTPPVAVQKTSSSQGTSPPPPGRFYSPLVLNIARTEGISMAELESVPGTGVGGRISKRDILEFAAARKAGTAPALRAAGAEAFPERVKPSAGGVLATPVDVPELRAKYPAPQHEILQMSNVLQKMASHMVQSVQTSPHAAAVHEVDMTGIVQHRRDRADEFERREGFKLTFTPYIVDAVVRAIKKYPLINSSIEGDKIIRRRYIHLGLAVASENGLIVPVIKNAEEKNFLGLARGVHDLVTRTRSKKLTPDDIQGGTFTISNYGVFGTVIGTPIISQPQIAILGTGAIRKRVAVINDALAIRSIAYFTLSFDHRIVDGALGGMFLEDIVQNLQNFDTRMKF